MTLRELFNTTSFSMGSLTASINELPYVPGRIGKLGIFDEEGVATTTVMIERQGTTLSIATTKPRGAPGTPIVADKRQAVTLAVPHVPVSAEIVADEIQGVREFGTTDQLRTMETLRDAKLLKMNRTLDMTLEYHRLGALQGIVLDADGETVLFNLFTTFGIEQPAANALSLNEAWAVDDGGVINGQLTVVKRLVRNALGGNDPDGYWVQCDDEFFDKLKNHPELRSTYLNQQAANNLRGSDPLDTFTYGGMTFENYRGKGAVTVPAGTGIVVPLGVPELFITRFAPAPWFSAVNTIGLPRYAMATLDETGEKRIDLEANMNPISICTRPEALQTLSIG